MDPFEMPFGMDPDALRDAPLFRELQRVMAASGGPVNWELARQTAIAISSEAGADTPPGEEDERVLSEAVRVAEMHVGSFTGMEAPAELPKVRAARRAEWVTAETEALAPLLEPAARRMSQALERSMAEQLPEGMGAIGAILQQLGPLLQAAQIGQTLGHLAGQTLGRYDIAVPRERADLLLFVQPNLEAFERAWSLDPVELRTWVALHEVTHRLEFARAWTTPHFASLIDDFLSTVTIDVSVIQERFAALDPNDPTSFERALGGGQEEEEEDAALFGPVLDDEQRLKLGRVQAFMAAAEGYADHVVHAVGKDLLATHDRISEAILRQHEGRTSDPVFERLLGIEMSKELYVRGRRFCDAVVELTDEQTLAQMWTSAEAVPALVELDEPRLWLARIV